MNNATPASAGFWVRVAASIIDSILAMAILVPLLGMLFGWDHFFEADQSSLFGQLLEWLLPAVAAILFWQARQATPGKMALGMRIVDAATLGKPTTRQWIIRYLGYYVSMIPFFLGFVWVAFDARKQGWHDKLAGTRVVFDRASAAPRETAAPRVTDDGEGRRFAGDPKRG